MFNLEKGPHICDLHMEGGVGGESLEISPSHVYGFYCFQKRFKQ